MNKVSKEELQEDYWRDGLTMKEISELHGVSVGKIHKLFHVYQIPIKSFKHYAKEGKFNQSEESRKKISMANKGKVVSESTRYKISESHKIQGIGHKKKRKDGYVAVFYPQHPNSTKDGYVMEHHLVMEQNIGRYIQAGEVVHHKNHKRDDNTIENLELMTFKEHASLHMKERHAENKRKEVLTYQ